MAVMAKWGKKKWEVSRKKVEALMDLNAAYTQIADDNSGTEDNSLSNKRGLQLIEISFKTVLNANAGVNVLKEINAWKNLVTATEFLYINGKKFGPRLQLREVKLSNVKMDDKGRFREATLNFTFKEYNEKTTSYRGISAKKVGRGAAWKKGSKVKIAGKKYADGKKIKAKLRKKTYKVVSISKGKAKLKGLKKKVRVKDLSLVK